MWNAQVDDVEWTGGGCEMDRWMMWNGQVDDVKWTGEDVEWTG